MSVPKMQRGESVFEPLLKARELASHTLKITANANIFKVQLKGAITDDLIRQAKDVYIKAWMANNVRVSDRHTYEIRRDLQNEAIRECYALLATMDLAKSVFHLRSKKVVFWARLCIDTREQLRRWRDNDNKRYGHL